MSVPILGRQPPAEPTDPVVMLQHLAGYLRDHATPAEVIDATLVAGMLVEGCAAGADRHQLGWPVHTPALLDQLRTWALGVAGRPAPAAVSAARQPST